MEEGRLTSQQIAFALQRVEAGTPVAEVCRKKSMPRAPMLRETATAGRPHPHKRSNVASQFSPMIAATSAREYPRSSRAAVRFGSLRTLSMPIGYDWRPKAERGPKMSGRRVRQVMTLGGGITVG